MSPGHTLPVDRVCEVCGTLLLGGKRKYCSQECREKNDLRGAPRQYEDGAWVAVISNVRLVHGVPMGNVCGYRAKRFIEGEEE